MSRVPAAKRRRLSPPDVAGTPPKSLRATSTWDHEQDYEQRPRKLSNGKGAQENVRLPVKTADGWEAPEAVPEDLKAEEARSHPLNVRISALTRYVTML